jgi:hypothetical protein
MSDLSDKRDALLKRLQRTPHEGAQQDTDLEKSQRKTWRDETRTLPERFTALAFLWRRRRGGKKAEG